MKQYRPDQRIFFGIIIAITITELAIADRLFGVTAQDLIIKSGAIAAANGALWLIFDNIAWRWPIAKVLGLSHVPYVGGEWVGELTRSGESEEHLFSLTVHQTFSAISISTKSRNSKSQSITATIVTDELKRNFKIINHWSGSTKSKTSGHMDDFRGLSTITIDQSQEEITLSDYYFTNRKPDSTEGVIRLRRKPN